MPGQQRKTLTGNAVRPVRRRPLCQISADGQSMIYSTYLGGGGAGRHPRRCLCVITPAKVLFIIGS